MAVIWPVTRVILARADPDYPILSLSRRHSVDNNENGDEHHFRGELRLASDGLILWLHFIRTRSKKSSVPGVNWGVCACMVQIHIFGTSGQRCFTPFTL